MYFVILALISALEFVPVESFADLDAVAAPTDFGFLLIGSSNPEADRRMAEEIIRDIDSLGVDGCTHISLYSVSMDAAGYTEIASLAGHFNGFPAVVSLVGHCGFLELDPSILSAEIEDAWYRWGEGHTQGICNYCTRCNPLAGR